MLSFWLFLFLYIQKSNLASATRIFYLFILLIFLSFFFCWMIASSGFGGEMSIKPRRKGHESRLRDKTELEVQRREEISRAASIAGWFFLFFSKNSSELFSPEDITRSDVYIYSFRLCIELLSWPTYIYTFYPSEQVLVK